MLPASNRTKVELKLQFDYRTMQRLHFQSNQSGIETERDPAVAPAVNTSNRTKVELKHDENVVDFVAKVTSNRTKVELKLYPI